ncbi:Transformer-2 sex-determining protein [Sergentomyia squamirostris]
MTSDHKTSGSSSSSEECIYRSRRKSSRDSGRHRRTYRSPSWHRIRDDERRHRYRSRSRSKRRNRSHYSRSPSFSKSPIVSAPKGQCLGVFGLGPSTTEEKIYEIFSKYGPIERTQLIMDAKTGRSRGYCFVYYQNAEDAKVAKDNCIGLDIDERRIRVDYSHTNRPHSPTPGVYMGRYSDRDRESGCSSSRKDEFYESNRYKTKYLDRRSPSPYRYRTHRSRSRSYSSRSRRYR